MFDNASNTETTSPTTSEENPMFTDSDLLTPAPATEESADTLRDAETLVGIILRNAAARAWHEEIGDLLTALDRELPLPGRNHAEDGVDVTEAPMWSDL